MGFGIRVIPRNEDVERLAPDVSLRVYASVPPKVEYSLTPLGRTLVDLLHSLRSWSEANIEEVLAAQEAYDRNAREVGESGVQEQAAALEETTGS